MWFVVDEEEEEEEEQTTVSSNLVYRSTVEETAVNRWMTRKVVPLRPRDFEVDRQTLG